VALEGLLNDLEHHREPLLDRRLAGAVDRRAGVGSTVATSRCRRSACPRACVPDGEEHALGVTAMAWSNASSVV